MRDININNTNATIVITVPELISILKSVLIDRINVDLDELNVIVLAKYSNNRLHITLDADSLRRESMSQYYQLIQNVKRIFSPYIFTVGTAIETNILINKLFAGFDYYKINQDMTIEIYY